MEERLQKYSEILIKNMAIGHKKKTELLSARRLVTCIQNTLKYTRIQAVHYFPQKMQS